VAHAVTVSLMYEPDIDWPVRSDVWTAAVLSVGWLDHRTVCRLMSALSRHCYVRHTCSLYGGPWLEMRGLISIHILSMRAICFSCQVRLVFIIIAVQWAYRYRQRHANRYTVFTDTATLRVFTRQYWSNTGCKHQCSWTVSMHETLMWPVMAKTTKDSSASTQLPKRQRKSVKDDKKAAKDA